MKRLMYIASLSAMVVLVLAAIALAQDSSDPASSDQAESTTSSEQTTPAQSSEQATPAESTSTVNILAGAFDPAQLSVDVGTTVTFVNEDTVPHTVVLDGLFSSYEILPGSSYPVWFDGSGTVTYHDELNPEMQGSITIGQEEAAAPAEPASVPTTTTDESTTPTSEDSTTTDSSS